MREKASAELDTHAYLTADEAADLLRTTRKAIYALIERGQLPGVRRLGRRVLVQRRQLVEWIEASAAT